MWGAWKGQIQVGKNTSLISAKKEKKKRKEKLNQTKKVG